jgi:rhodanese-related sulfurtransferase
MQIAARADELGSKDQEIVVYCEVGPRARYAQTTLNQAGFTAVRHLAGDMAAWRQAGLPVQRR